MRLLNRYLTKEIFTVFFICLTFFLTFIIIGKLIHLKELFLGQDVSLGDIGLAFLYLSPSFLIILIPVSCMLSIFLVFLRMTSDREMIALRTSSLSFKNFTYAPFLFSFFCFIFSLYISIFLLPKGIDKFRAKCVEIIKSKTELALRPGVVTSSFPNLIIYFKGIDLKTKEMKNIFIEERKGSFFKRVVLAKNGYIYYDKNKNKIIFELLKGNIYRFSDRKNTVLKYQKYDVILDLKNIIGNFKLEEKRPKEMYLSEIKKIIDSNLENSNIAKMELSRRFALPFSCIILSFFVLPLSLTLSGLKQQYGAVICLISFLLYYTLYSISYSLGETGKVNSYLSMWIPNIILVILTSFNFYLLKKDITIYGFVKRLFAKNENTN